MAHIYYLFTFMFLIYEFMTVVDPIKIHRFAIKFKNRDKNKEMSSNENIYLFFNLFYMTWALLGLLTFQWPIFLYIVIAAFIPKTWIVWRWIDAAIGVIILLFIILNKYHFQIDLWPIIQVYITG